MATPESAATVDYGPDRVISDLAAEPEHVQEAARRLYAEAWPEILAEFPPENETYFIDQ